MRHAGTSSNFPDSVSGCEVLSAPEDQLEPYGSGLLGLVLRHSTERPAAPALKDDDETLSYAELCERVAPSASGLHVLGAEPGDRIVLLLPNSAGLVVCALACLWLGAAFVPLSLEEPPARLEHLVSDCRPARPFSATAMKSLAFSASPIR